MGLRISVAAGANSMQRQFAYVIGLGISLAAGANSMQRQFAYVMGLGISLAAGANTSTPLSAALLQRQLPFRKGLNEFDSKPLVVISVSTTHALNSLK